MDSIRRRLRHRDDSGFGLIETVIALLLAGIVFSALASTLVSAVQASLFGRQNQQATDFMTREIERMRTLDFGALANTAADIAGDPRLADCGAVQCLTVDTAAEPIVTATAGAVSPHISTVSGAEANNTVYTVYRYVTQVSGLPVDQARRATVYITWFNKGALKTRSLSTVIAYTQRGLPLPEFRLELPVPSVTVNPGAAVTYAVTLTNQGAPDHWNLTLSSTSTGWGLYADTNGNGSFDGPTVDLPLADTTGDGIVDTGRIDPSTTFRFFLSRQTSSSEPLATTTTTITATSVAQPTATGGVKSVVATTIVQAGAVTPTPPPTTPPPSPSPETTCPATTIDTPDSVSRSYSLQQYALHNPGVGATVLQPQMYFDSVAGSEPVLPDYSTDVGATATGRVLAPVGATLPPATSVTALTDDKTYADWAMQLGNQGKFDGTGVLHLWVARYGGGTGTVSGELVLYTATGTSSGLSRSVLTSQTVSLGALSCAGFQEFYVKLPEISSVQVAKNDWVGIRLVMAGTDSVRLAYDVPSQFPASFTIGAK